MEDGLAEQADSPTFEEAPQDINPEEAGKTVGGCQGQKMAKVKSEILSGLGRMMSFHVEPATAQYKYATHIQLFTSSYEVVPPIPIQIKSNKRF